MEYSPSEQPRPSVWKWFVAYCVMMALMFVLLVVMGVVYLFVSPAELDMPAAEAKLMSITFIVLGLVFAVPYAAAPFLPRRRWAWILGVVLICLGMMSTCCLPAAIPLLVFWVKRENSDYFR